MKKKLQFLAHFATQGGQNILAVDRDDAVRQGERAARRLGTQLADVTGPDESE